MNDIASSASLPSLDGFDPLTERFGDEVGEKTIFEEATKRVVQNILKSYTGYFDLFSELIQNALDAIEARISNGDTRRGQIAIHIDMSSGVVRVVDNGTGMGERELRYAFRPSVSFKNRKESRGHKGVGATFLAYGFDSVSITTRNDAGVIAVQMDGGRSWADDTSNSYLRPKLTIINPEPNALIDEHPGTSVRVRIGKNRPELSWWGATSAEQWLEILRARTPLGGVYIHGKKRPDISAEVHVIDSAGTRTSASTEMVEYVWPHELSVLSKVRDLDDVMKALTHIDGDLTRLPNEYKNVSALYKVWTVDDLIDDNNRFWSSTFDDAEQQLIIQHSMSVYGCFLSSATSWTEYQSERLKIRKTPLILKGGMQIASDNMIQGDLSVIPLTSTIGYQANTHVVVHFRDGNPDMGRKVFQPELKSLAEKTSRQVVNIFKKYLHLMREDTGSPTVSESSDKWDWQLNELRHATENPFSVAIDSKRLAYCALPRSEQDVIALFHEMIGAGFISGIEFIGTSGVERYDSCYRLNYKNSSTDCEYQKSNNPLGASKSSILPKESKPFVLEYKFNLDSLISDFEKELKFIKDIDLVVCWSIGSRFTERYRINSYMVGEEGSSRAVFGATHSLWSEKEKRFDIICLEDLVSYIHNPEHLIAEHQHKFKE